MTNHYEQVSPLYEGTDNPMHRHRFSQAASFMRTPVVKSLSDVDIGIIGIPFDGGVTNRPGARHGPRELRNQSSFMRDYNQATGVNPYTLCRVGDLGDVRIESPYTLERSLDDIAEVYHRIREAGIIPLSAGGDHSVTLPIFRGIAKERPVGMIHFDAHCDTGMGHLGSKFHHGAPFSRAVEEGLLDPKRTVQIGIRGTLNNPDEWKFSHDSGMRVVYMEELYERGPGEVIKEAIEIVGDGPTYISFDVDGLDPVYTPGTGTPEVGGFSVLEAQLMIRELAVLDLVGGDLVEVAPPFDPSGNTALVGASIMYEILCVLATAFARRSSGD